MPFLTELVWFWIWNYKHVAPAALEIMKTEYLQPTEIGRQRHAWSKAHVKPGMTFEEAVRLNNEALQLFPPTEEERRLKFESLKDVPEFVL